jgi:hypothetical protein
MRNFLYRTFAAVAVAFLLLAGALPAGAVSTLTDYVTQIISAGTNNPYCIQFSRYNSGATSCTGGGTCYGFSSNDPGVPQSLLSLNTSRDNSTNITFSYDNANVPSWANPKSDGTNSDCDLNSITYVWRIVR